MSTLGLVLLIVYGVGALVCWRCVTLALLAEPLGDPPDRLGIGPPVFDLWVASLFLGAMAAAIWPLVLLFWRPSA